MASILRSVKRICWRTDLTPRRKVEHILYSKPRTCIDGSPTVQSITPMTHMLTLTYDAKLYFVPVMQRSSTSVTSGPILESIWLKLGYRYFNARFPVPTDTAKATERGQIRSRLISF